MTRDEFASLIRWPRIFRVIGIINPFIMVPQLYKIWRTMEAADLSLITLGTVLAVQVGFSLHGFFKLDKTLMRSNFIAAVMTIITLISIPIIQTM